MNNICIPTQIPRNGRPDDTEASCVVLQSRAAERVHAGAERTHTGQHDAGGVTDQTGVGGEAGVGAALLDRLLRRVQVADAVVEHGDQRPIVARSVRSGPVPGRTEPVRHSTPLVDGTPPGSSMRTASRSDRARPLKVASTM